MSIKGERLKVIKEFPDYAISNFGRVFSFTKCGFLSLHYVKNNYVFAVLFKDKKRHYKRVHRLVAKSFLNPSNKIQINHKDGDKHNNYYKNLEWVTSKENINHYLKSIGYQTKRKTRSAFLTQEIADKIRHLYFVEKINQVQLGKIFNTNRTNVCNIIANRRWPV